MFFLGGLTEYASPLVAQHLGSGNEKKCPIVITQAMIVTLMGYPIILCCIPLGSWLFNHIGQDQQQIECSPEVNWAVFVFTMPVIALTFYLRYKHGGWRTLEIIDYKH